MDYVLNVNSMINKTVKNDSELRWSNFLVTKIAKQLF